VPDPAETLIVHPGDIIQITDSAHELQRALLIVHETHAWGVGAMVQALRGGELQEAYQRIKPGTFAVVGAALLLPEDVTAARRASVEHAREVTREQEITE
jgi:hypothetical protein